MPDEPTTSIPTDAELRERLAEVLGNPGLAARLGRRARQLALDRFTWQAVAERCLAAYAELP